MKIMRGMLLVAVAGLLLSGCAGMNDYLTPKTKTGAGIGAVAGGILGALVDSSQPWRGAVIGAAAGAVAGGWIGHTMDKNTGAPVVQGNSDIVNQAAQDAARQNATVNYSRTTEGGVKEEVIATPGSLTTDNRRTVTIRYYRDGRLISTETREVPV